VERDSIRRGRILTAVGIVLSLCLLARQAQFLDWSDPNVDFTPMYVMAELGPKKCYDLNATVTATKALGLGINYEIMPHPRLPFLAALYSPLARLPFPTARTIWRVLMIAALAGSAWAWPRHGRLVGLVLLTSGPALWIVHQGQDVPLVLLLASVCVRMHNQGKPLAAGVALGLCVLKYHLFPFVALAIIARREWRMVAGAAATVLLLLCVSFALAGPEWPRTYVATLAANSPPYSHVMPALVGFAAGHPIGFAAVAIAAGVGTVLAAIRTDLPTAVATALTIALMVNVHTYPVDGIITAPLAAECLANVGTLRALGVAIAAPVLWLLASLGTVWPLRIALSVAAIALVAAHRACTLQRCAP
jgi:hypothetical protein